MKLFAYILSSLRRLLTALLAIRIASLAGKRLVAFLLFILGFFLLKQNPLNIHLLAEQSAEQASRLKSQNKGVSWTSPESINFDAGIGYQRLLALQMGFRQYKQGNFAEAADILDPSGLDPFLLADYSDYFFALSVVGAGFKQKGIDVLEGFSAQYPASPYVVQALGKRAEWLMEEEKVNEAVLLLQENPLLSKEPSLLLLLGKAHLENQQPKKAISSYQQVYFFHPLGLEAKEAGQALRRLRKGRVAEFPQVPKKLQIFRADALYRNSSFKEAADAYGQLIEAFPSHPSREKWQLCRILASPLRKKSDRARAIAALSLLSPRDPAVDAERLAAMVKQFRHLRRISEMHDALDILASKHSDEGHYRAALMEVGNYYLLEGDRKRAGEFYGTPVGDFPKGDRAAIAQWRFAWSTHLQRKKEDAERLFIEHILHYPSSSEVSTALYWLGRYAQDESDFGPARAYFRRAVKLYPFSYFGIQARKQLQEGWGSVEAGPRNKFFPLSLPRELTIERHDVSKTIDAASISQSLMRADALQNLRLDDLEWLELDHSFSRWPNSREVNLALAKRNFRLRNHGSAIHYAFRAYPYYRSIDIQKLPQEIWSILFPRPYAQEIRKAASRNGLEPELVMALIRQESSFRPRARSRSNARGLMQLITPTARQMARQAGKRYRTRYLYNPAYNLELGCRYLSYLVDRYDGQIEQALAAYNSGPHRVDAWTDQEEYYEPAEFVASIRFSETRAYVRLVMSNWEFYRRLSRVSQLSRSVDQEKARPSSF